MAKSVWLDDVRSPRCDENEAREGNDGTNCLLCGRRTNPQTQYMVRMTVYGELVAPDAKIHPDDDQGGFPVGPECRRKIPGLAVRGAQ